MIQKLNESHRESLLNYVKQQPEINLFIIGDVEAFGFDKDFQEIWGEFDEEGNYRAVLLRYHTSFIFYTTTEDSDVYGFKTILDSYPERELVSGETSCIDQFLKVLPYKKKQEEYFTKLTTGEKLDRSFEQIPLQKAIPEDAEDIYTLRGHIREFDDFKASVESIRHNLECGFGRNYYVKEGDKIIASAATTAENSASAMIVGVATHPEYRKNGYATACVSKLCEELLSEGKSLCLFYDNPKAGSIYRRIGFEDIGKWTMVVL